MYRFLLTPRWLGVHLFVVLAVPFCIFMGSWQLSRFEARMNSHHAAEQAPRAAASAAPVPLAAVLPDTKAQVTQDTSGRTVTATGRYDTGHQFLVPGRDLGDRTGYYVLTPLRTTGGAALPVVRGWLPGAAPSAAPSAASSATVVGIPAAPGGDVTVSGALQSPENTGTQGVQSGGGLPQGQLGMISAASLVNVLPYDVYSGWITLTETTAPLTPVPPAAPGNTGLDLKAFQNLGYTGEWFVFAGFVVFMWFRLVRREAELRADTALGLIPDEDVSPVVSPGRLEDSSLPGD
ncbi:SURF1 family protein [Streptomyces sp. H10-C2]|uniref:SURF1 family protein n=1 Tax=unclassified Streptomyces TaxID=2593676 RepID=UPI0024BBE4C0|nr:MULTISPECIES: SURF1 family protein [unclassified Streptomyces]MDJ0342612.1 SURF1 family protein [Streptomyces sp. PH10-H1]MDJ0368534.1 SURF1 family protein [Streptomyces sp. H10-C2]